MAYLTVTTIFAETGEHKTVEMNELITLEAMQKAVGGFIEMVPVRMAGERAVLVLNEDGMALNLYPNIIATEMFKNQVHLGGGFALGDCLVISGPGLKDL